MERKINRLPQNYKREDIKDKEKEGEKMNFDSALIMMKDFGHKMKLPSWSGYWEWDNSRETIMMHTKEGAVLDIRETERVEYTLKNIMSARWEKATDTNCELLGGTNKFGFDDAIKYLKRGLKVKRVGWNGKDQYIELATCISCENSDGEAIAAEHEDIGSAAILFHGTRGSQLGWLASQSDMLADDWTFYNNEEK